MKHYKLLAGVMAAVMVLGNSFVALADSGATTGEGSLDIAKNSDVFNVVLPTVPEDGSVFDYILDPTGVIKESGAAKYDSATFEDDQTLFFLNTSGDYSHTSDELTVINKSTMDVDITINAMVAKVAGISMAETDSDLDGSTGARLYLGLKDSENYAETALPLTTRGVEATATIAATEGAYHVTYNAEGGYYEKTLSGNYATDNGLFESYTFSLEGACSAEGWDKISTVTPPAVTVVWTIEDPTRPSVTLTSTGLITVSGLTADCNYAGAISIGDATTTKTQADRNIQYNITDWTAESGGTFTILLPEAYVDYWAGKLVTVTVKLTDGTMISAKNTITGRGPVAYAYSSGLLTVTRLTADCNYNGKMTFTDGTITKDQTEKTLVFNTDNWTNTSGGTFTLQMPEGWIDYWDGKEVTITIGLTDGSSITTKVLIAK